MRPTNATFILLAIALACRAAPLEDQCVVVPSHLRPGGCQTNPYEVTVDPPAEPDSDPQETLATSTGATSSYVPPASTPPLPSVSIHPWFGLGFVDPPAWPKLPSHHGMGTPARSVNRDRKRVFVEQPSSISAAAPASTSIPSIEDICKGRPPHLHMWSSDPNDPICPLDRMAPRMHVGRGYDLAGPLE
ncbi:hypothetical protein BDZ89DRAFT_1065982 [Hymenopellis radicata]|nr:hypothetical protein BDZ89DRAFT_1065982 [Hymenopellis radicata]